MNTITVTDSMKTDFANPDQAPQTDANIFGPVHKSIRRALADVLGQLGAADFEDAESLAQLGREVEATLTYCEQHVDHEERVVRPACAGRLVPEVFDTGHPEHLRMIAELRAQLAVLKAASAGQRSDLGHTLYLHFSVFAADCLHHMAEEERVLLPHMRRTLGDEALFAIRARILASLSPAEQAQSARLMLGAMNPGERRALTLDIAAKAPRELAMALLESARPMLSAAAFNDLVQLVDSAPVAH